MGDPIYFLKFAQKWANAGDSLTPDVLFHSHIICSLDSYGL